VNNGQGGVNSGVNGAAADGGAPRPKGKRCTHLKR